MGVGHAAVALGATRYAPRLNVAWLIFAALLADFLLGLFALAGLEGAHVPPDFASHHYLTFTFPYSHGLLMLLLWSAAFGALAASTRSADRARVFVVVGLVVFSHFVLDALVHVVGLPLAFEGSPKIGLGLWTHLRLELCIETVMTVAGIAIYLGVAGAMAPARSRFGVPIVVAVVAAGTWSQLFATVAPEPRQLAPGWIGVPLVLGALCYGLDRARVQRTSRSP
jgi:hypothetical protein